MNDLYRLIAEMNSTVRDGLAQVWHVQLDSPDPIRQAQALGDAMCSDGLLLTVSQGLSPQSQDLLGHVAAQGGSLPLQRLQSYGSIRKLGNTKLVREQPWLFPQGPLEELVYKGLCFVAYRNTSERLLEQLVIPDQMLENIKDHFPVNTAPLVVECTPDHTLQSGRSFAEDIMALLVSIRQHMPHANSRRGLLAALDAEIERLALLRLVGPHDPDRLTLIRELVIELGLVKPEHGRLMPSPKARNWLRESDQQLGATLLAAWRRLAHWKELELVPDLDLDRHAQRHDPRNARRIIIKSLSLLPVDQWISMTAFVNQIRLDHPDLLRPDGDMQSWRIHDASTGELLSGFSHWEQIEGAAIRTMLERPLWWLGTIDLGENKNTFRITPLGASCFSVTEPADSVTPTNIATMDSTFRVHIPTADTIYDRYQLERFAQWESQNSELATLRITANSVWEGQNADVPIERIQRFLERITNGQIPDIVRQTLQAWGIRFGRVMIRHVVMLETDDKETMQSLRDWPETGLLIETIISPTTCLVREENVHDLTIRLKQRGIWPHIHSGPA